MEFDARAFGEKLAALLKERNLTQEDFANSIDIHPVIISYWANGRRIPSVENLFKISISLNVSADYLLGLCDAQIKMVEGLKTELNKCIKEYIKIGA